MNWTTLFKKFTNGKYIIGLLAVAFLSIGSYSYAYVEGQEYTVSCTEWSCRSVAVDFRDSIGIIAKSNTEGCTMISLANGPSNRQNIVVLDKIGVLQETKFSVNNVYATANCNEGNGNIKFTLAYPDPPLVTGGTSNFTPIITRLANIAGEFIPYMIYIAIACLGVTLAFNVLRYIISYLQSKSKGAVRGK